MLQGTALVQANTLTPKAGEPIKADKNGLQSIILTSLAGAIPSNRTISGTIADNLGIEAGGTYLVDYNEVAPVTVNGKLVRNFRFMNLIPGGVKSLADIAYAKKEYGVGRVIDVSKVDAAPSDPQTPSVPSAPDASAPQP